MSLKQYLIFPHRGYPPPVPKFYEPEPGDPFVMRLSLIQCEKRKFEFIKTQCCQKEHITCDGKTITRSTCVECKKEKYV